MLAIAAVALGACVTLPSHPPPGRLVSRVAARPQVEKIVVNAGGRDISAWVLLPEGYDAGRRYPVAVTIHNFGGDASGFVELIDAWRLAQRDVVVISPQAGGLARDWKGPGITLIARAVDPEGRPVDDVAAVAGVLEAARGLYSLAPDDVNVIGFSQGATMAMALTRRLDAQRPGAVRRLFLAAGSLASPPDATLAMKGTDIVAYEPGHNWPQAMADLRLGEPPERVFLPELLRIKQCRPVPTSGAPGTPGAGRATGGAPTVADYDCPDGARVTHILEPDGEHAWPGQDRKYDSWTGRGSTSAIDFTGLIADAIAPRRP